MKVKEVQKPAAQPYISREAKELRDRSPYYLKRVIEHTYGIKEVKSFKEIDKDKLVLLSGVMASSCYLLNLPHNRVDYKGEVPTRRKKGKVKYLIAETVINTKGHLAQTAIDYCRDFPDKSLSSRSLLWRVCWHGGK